MTELEIAKNIIISYLSTNVTAENMYVIYELRNGNNKELLEHIKALISIFQKAKEQLEADND